HRQPMASATEITDLLLEAVVADLELTSGQEALLFVNVMGATPSSELYIVYGRARSMLAEKGVAVARSLVGSSVTSPAIAGASITVMRLDDELRTLWDAPVNTPALRWGM